jgi:hypothetical protein
MKKQKAWYQRILPHKLVEKKKYLEFFTALLSIPVLITVIILNFNSVQNLKTAKPTDAPQKQGGFFSMPIEKNTNKLSPTTSTNSQTTTSPCKKQLGPIAITSPEEGEAISQNPVSVNISYDDDSYCAAVWSYRINGSSWSEYDNRSLALYNLPVGKIKFELKVKSIVSKEEQTLTRNFINKAEAITATPSMTQDQLGTSSAK